MRISVYSRYKRTRLYAENGQLMLGPFISPEEFRKPEIGWLTHIVRSQEVGFPDILAVRYYGEGAEQLWWAICLPNGIIDPDLDMWPGQTLYIPPRDLVSRYTLQGS